MNPKGFRLRFIGIAFACSCLRVFVVALLCIAALALMGCVPGDRLVFPEQPSTVTQDARHYDTDHDGRADFSFAYGQGELSTVLDELRYDDDQDGRPDRLFRLSDYNNQDVPHLIVLLDSIPFEAMREESESSDRFSFLGPTVKVICPFPSMSAVCFSAILHAPPMPGPINRSYDPRPQSRGVNNLISKRWHGYRNPWQQRLHYNIDYKDNTNAFLKPRPWMRVEFARARQALDDSPDRVTIVYISSTAAMLAKYGRRGLDETLDELQRFLLQVLHERRGAIKISVMADHGHNLTDSTWLDIEKTLENKGFRVTDNPRKDSDVFLEQDGLLTFFGVHTSRPVAVGDALLEALPQVETLSYMDGHDVVVRNHDGSARIRKDGEKIIYTPASANVLGYDAALCGAAMSRDDWFSQTCDDMFPDAPARLWDAFHGRTVNTPQVMVTLDDGHVAGIGWFQWFIKMRSTHGGLNQVNSATFLMSMTGRTAQRDAHGGGSGVLRSGEVLDVIEPGWMPRVLP